MSRRQLNARVKPASLVVVRQGRELVILDAEPDGSDEMVLIRLNVAAARRIAGQLLQGALDIENARNEKRRNA